MYLSTKLHHESQALVTHRCVVAVGVCGLSAGEGGGVAGLETGHWVVIQRPVEQSRHDGEGRRQLRVRCSLQLVHGRDASEDRSRSDTG